MALLAVGSAVALVLAVYALRYAPPPAEVLDLPGNPEYDLGETLIQGPPLFVPEWNDCTEDYRPTYGLSCLWQELVFGALPSVRADMSDVSKAVFESGIVQLDRIPSAYWTQPEFYPGWSQAHVDQTYADLEQNRSTPIGFGAYPFGQGLRAREGTASKTFVTFLHGGWGITHWQGMVLEIVLPRAAIRVDGDPLMDEAGNPVTQDPAVAARMNPRFTFAHDPVYGRSSADLVEPLADDQRMIVLAPNYPAFRTGWTQAISVDVDLADLPPGTYFFLVMASVPSAEIGEVYTFEYGLRYQASGFGVPLFEGIIVVV